MAMPSVPAIEHSGAFEAVASVIAQQVAAGKSIALEAGTGTGKTTKVPGALAEALAGTTHPEVWVAGPRAEPTRRVAEQAAANMGGRLGSRVGVCTGQHADCAEGCQVHYVTDRVALLRMIDKRSMLKLGAIVIDEADFNLKWYFCRGPPLYEYQWLEDSRLEFLASPIFSGI